MALDYGEKYIGIAINDVLLFTAQGRPTLVRTNLRDDLAHILELATAEQVGTIIIGLPLSEDGADNPISLRVRAFAKQLEKKIKYSTKGYESDVAIEFWDERFTTQDADLLLSEGEIPKKNRKKYLDRLAAVLLLEDYLSSVGVPSNPNASTRE